MGIGPAYKAGFNDALARGADYVIQMDADLSHPVEMLPKFVELMDQADVVLGSRYIRGITVVNSPGTIDSDYRGEVKVALINLSRTAFSIERGMRVAQLLVVPIPRIRWEEVTELPDTTRGEGGFGHTGQ